ncbi:hypothetical protein ScPMuIL_007269 [Solemya velum]
MLLIIICLTGLYLDLTSALACGNLTLVSRQEWGARLPKTSSNISTPVNDVFVHHTAMSPCYSLSSCSQEMRTIQNFHMDIRGWDDLGYSFLVGEDGRVYESRGWDRQGAHTKGWNTVAVAVSVMGNFMTRLPNEAALRAVRNLIACGVEMEKVTPTYHLYGHRDVKSTACPGDTLYAHIQLWSHFGPLPADHP